MSVNYKAKKIQVKRSYQILALILLVLSAGLLLIPEQKKHEGVSPEQYVSNILSKERYIHTDDLADRIINQDPTLLLVDTRSLEAFENFSLPDAINIPLAELFSPELNAYLDQDIYNIVLFSNDNYIADQAWMLCNRMGYQRVHVLEGGLNAWFKDIIQPTPPDETMSVDAFNQYAFRKAAGMYFGVSHDTLFIETKKVQTSAPKKVVPKPKKKKRMPEGGC